MRNLKKLKNVDVIVDFEAHEIAEMFCEMDADQMAVFFNTVGRQVKLWEGTFDAQMYAVSEKELTNDGKRIMKTIGDYAPPQI